MRRSHPPRGFTLIEVMVALVIMSVLAIMAWQGVDGIVRARTASQERLEQLLRVNTVLAQFQQDLESVQDSGVLPGPTFDGISMRLTRRHTDGLQVVVWSLRGGTWMRWAGPPVRTTQALLNQWASSQQFIGNEAGQLRTITGVTGWQAFCYRTNAWSNCQSSAGTGAQAGGSPLPPGSAATTDPLVALRVVLTLGEGSSFSGSVTREIALEPQ